MLLPNTTARRLGVFFFYDANGIVDDYIPVLLDGMASQLSKLIIVCNGQLSESGRKRLEQFSDDIIVRDNRGFDVWAYKAALDQQGWDELARYDEIVLFNMTIMGPVYPFSEMFDEMGRRDLDFWGITKFHSVPFDPFGYSSDGTLHEHIQSHFMAFRSSFHTSQAFKDYWTNAPIIKSYQDSVGLHEAPFTDRFHKLGFSWDIYADSSDWEGYTFGPVTYAAKELIALKRCPIFKRRSFFHDYDDVLDQSLGTPALDLYEFLRDNTQYDTDLIWQNALRTMNLADVNKDLHLSRILPCTPSSPATSVPKNHSAAFIVRLRHPEATQQTDDLLSLLPDCCDMFIVIDKTQFPDLGKRLKQKYPHTTVCSEQQVCPFISRYEAVCIIHDDTFPSKSLNSVGAGIRNRCLGNVAVSPQYVAEVVDLFTRDHRLGIAMPPAPNHAEYFSKYTFGWSGNFVQVEKLLASTGANVPLDESKEPVAPIDGIFWFRPAALHNVMSTVVHGHHNDSNSLSYSYVAQSNGFYSLYIMSERLARVELTNLSFETRELTKAAISYSSALSSLREVSTSIADNRKRSEHYAAAAQSIKRIPGATKLFKALFH